VVPPDSGSLDGALDFSVQSVCPGLSVAHPDVPRNPEVMAMVVSVLNRFRLRQPGPEACVSP
jgi:triacylglycerol lipase